LAEYVDEYYSVVLWEDACHLAEKYYIDPEIMRINISESIPMGLLLPELSESLEILPENLLNKAIPGIFAKIVITQYIRLAAKSEDGYVDSDMLIEEVTNFLVDSAEDFFEENWKEFFPDADTKEIERDLIEEGYNEDFDEMFQEILSGLFEYGGDFFWASDTVRAVQEIEGLMSYCVDNNGEVCDITAPVQCGIMDMGERRRLKSKRR